MVFYCSGESLNLNGGESNLLFLCRVMGFLYQHIRVLFDLIDDALDGKSAFVSKSKIRVYNSWKRSMRKTERAEPISNMVRLLSQRSIRPVFLILSVLYIQNSKKWLMSWVKQNSVHLFVPPLGKVSTSLMNFINLFFFFYIKTTHLQFGFIKRATRVYIKSDLKCRLGPEPKVKSKSRPINHARGKAQFFCRLTNELGDLKW